MTLLTVLASALLSFSLFFFNPLFIYFSDPERLGDLPSSFVLQALGIAILGSGLVALPCRWLGRKYSFAVCFACISAFLYSYVLQINFGLFRGNQFGDEELIFRTARIAYVAEPLALAALFLVLRQLFRLKESVLSIFLGFLLLSQGYQLFLASRSTDEGPQEQPGVGEESVGLETIFHFSRDEPNILLFIPDAGAGYVLPELMAEGDRSAAFDGFVNYRNTVSVGSYTMSSTAALIGGPRYFPDAINARNDKTILEHALDAYNWLTGTLTAKGYDTTLINPKYTRCRWIKNTTHCANTSDYKRQLEDEYGFEAINIFNANAIRYFALFKCVPYSIKPMVYRSSGWKEALEGPTELATTINRRYHDYLLLKALPTLSDASQETRPQFNLYWHSELIAPFNLDFDCQPLTTGREAMYAHESRINATRCMLDGLSAWFQWMKDEGVYDNTKIIIAADHGAGRYNEEWHRRAVNPMLLVKDFNSRGSLESSDLLMQNSDVPALICSALGGCDGIDADPSKFPIPNRVAKYFYTTHGNYAYADKHRQFEIRKVFEIQGDLRENPAFDLD